MVGKARLEVGDSDVLIGRAASTLSRGEAWVEREWWRFAHKHVLAAADPVLRLALEIAANEEAERVAAATAPVGHPFARFACGPHLGSA